jgi:hypothetical protein
MRILGVLVFLDVGNEGGGGDRGIEERFDMTLLLYSNTSRFTYILF